MKISFSSATEWRACQQRYYYSYVEGLEPKVEFAPPMQLGRIIHKYLQWFYEAAIPDGTKRRPSPAVRHKAAINRLATEFTEEYQKLAVAAQAAGQDDVGLELLDLVPKAQRLCQSYFSARGVVEDHTILLCEEYIVAQVDEEDIAPVIVDLVTKDPEGKIWIWEHKTTKNIPPQQRRLRDLQTLLGAVILEEVKGLKIDGVIWNYIRTKEPTIPHLLKNGALSQAKDIDTTWQVYYEAVQRHKLDPYKYQHMQHQLEDRTLNVFFPRMELPVLQSEHILLRDLIQTRDEIRRATEDPSFHPVRNLSPQCDYCRFGKLCDAAILGDGDAELKQRLFKVRRRDGYTASPVHADQDEWE